MLTPGQARPGGPGKKVGSESISLLQEMKMKQEHRERRKQLQQELEALGREAAATGQGDISRMGALKVQLATVESYLARTDGQQSLRPEHPGLPAHVVDDKDSSNLYLGSLAPQWTEEMINREFGRFGHITSIKIMYPRTGRQMASGMCTGFVQFATRKQAELARATMAGREYFGLTLKVEFSKPVAPAVVAPSVTGLVQTPSSGPTTVLPAPVANPGNVGAPLPPAAPPAAGGVSQDAGKEAPRRKSKFDMAKTFCVVKPSSASMKHLIDRTAEFVAMEGWEFEKLLLERERSNPQFNFIWAEEGQEDFALHVYYRWKTFSLLQGDSVELWRSEPFQIYTNGALWQPPPREQQTVDEMVAQSSAPRIGDAIQAKPGGSAGGAELPAHDSATLDSLIMDKLTVDRCTILEAMVFCLDNAACSQAIAHRICNALIDEQQELTVPQITARLFLLSDVLYNAHCTKPGAAMYRRQFQQYLPEVFKRLRQICDRLSPLAASCFCDKVKDLVRTWISWSSFPKLFTQGLESTLCHATPDDVLRAYRRRWELVKESATLERDCRTRGLVVHKDRDVMIDQLCCYEVYWRERVAPDDGFDPDLDGDPLEQEDVNWMEEQIKEQANATPSSTATVVLSGVLGVAMSNSGPALLSSKLAGHFAGSHGDTVCAKEAIDLPKEASSTSPHVSDKFAAHGLQGFGTSSEGASANGAASPSKVCGLAPSPKAAKESKTNPSSVAVAQASSSSSSSLESDLELKKKKKRRSKDKTAKAEKSRRAGKLSKKESRDKKGKDKKRKGKSKSRSRSRSRGAKRKKKA